MAKILFIKKNGRWEFPKGRLKKGSKRKSTALREIYEETGISKEDLNIVKPLIPTYDNIKIGKNAVTKKTYWYLMTTSYDGILEPQLDEGIYRAEWKSKDEVPDLMENAYQNIKLLLKEIELI